MKHLNPRRLLSLVLAMVMVFGLMSAGFVPARAADTDPSDDSWDIPLTELAVSCGDWQTGYETTEGPAALAVDGDTATMWHTNWYGTSRENHWFQFKVTGEYAVNALRYLPRQTGNSNGTITEYAIKVSDDGETWTEVTTGTWAADSTWKIAEFEPQSAKYIRLYSIDAVTDNAYVFASAAELRLTYQPTQAVDSDKTALNALIAECVLIEEGNYTAKSWQDFQKALEKAQTVSANIYASQAQVDEAYEALLQAKEALTEKVEGEEIQKIFHLDNGRKMYSKDWIIALLNELAAADYTHLQLAFGNNGLRFVLDDMTIEANDTTYASDDVKAGIKIGNANYYDEGDNHALTEAEMDEIIAHAASVGIEIVPHLNMPGHMSALLDAMEYVGIADAHFTGYVQSDSSVNLNNEQALNFMYALVEKYAAYFSGKGCKYFHIGADEYANDAYNGNMGFPNMGATLYAKFAEFVNNNAAIVKEYGMTPRAWNDGIRYTKYSNEFDTDIEITYWSSGWWGYDVASAAAFDEEGHGLINTNGDYYYVLGKDDRFTTGSSTEHDPNLYTECAGYDLNAFMGNSTIENPIGGMFCVWADYPGAETEQEVAENIRLVLRAMSMRMDGLDIDDLDTSVVPGGFNEDGSINEDGEAPHVHTWSDWTVTKEATCTEEGSKERVCECGEKETEVIPALGHNWDEGEVHYATCTEDGYTTYTCLRCGETENKFAESALGHDYINGECSRCDAVKTSKFEDVPAGAFYFDPVEWAVEKGVTTGATDTLFDPNGNCLRGHVVTFLWRAAGSPEPTSNNNPFTDVTENDFFYKAVLWAVENGITNGTSATEFSPYKECNRAQVVTFLWRSQGSPDSTAEVTFADVEEGQFYTTAVAWAVENGITNGMGDGTFGVEGVCNRAQVVTFLYRTLAE